MPVSWLEPADHGGAAEARLSIRGFGHKVDHTVFGLALNHPVEAGPSLLANFAQHAVADFHLGARAEPFGRHLAGAVAHAIRDIVTGDDKIRSVRMAAAQNDMGVRVVGVPVIDGDPIELRAEIGFHAAHEVARIGLEVADVAGVLGRHDEAELVPVLPPALLEGDDIGLVRAGAVGARLAAVLGYAVALDVTQMHDGRAPAGLLQIHQPGLDDDAARIAAQGLAGELRRHMAAAEPGAAARGFSPQRPAAGRPGLRRGLEHAAGELRRPRTAARFRRRDLWPEAVVVTRRHDDAPDKPRQADATKHAIAAVAATAWPLHRHAALSAACRHNRRADNTFRTAACRPVLSCPAPQARKRPVSAH
jgi:hypothetical protein